MENEKNQSGQELLDIDDQGNYNENQKEKEQKKSNTCKYCLICICLIVLLGLGCFFYYNKKSNKTIYDKTKLKNLNLKSRIIFGPIFDNSFTDGKMSEKWIQKFETMAKNNVLL